MLRELVTVLVLYLDLLLVLGGLIWRHSRVFSLTKDLACVLLGFNIYY